MNNAMWSLYSVHLRRGKGAMLRVLAISMAASSITQVGLIAIGQSRAAARINQEYVNEYYTHNNYYWWVVNRVLDSKYIISSEDPRLWGGSMILNPHDDLGPRTSAIVHAVITSIQRNPIIIGVWASGFPLRCAFFDSNHQGRFGHALDGWREGHIEFLQVVQMVHVLPWRLAVNLLLGMIPFLLAALALRLAFMQYRRFRGRCVMCGYPTPQPKNMPTICPECGDGDAHDRTHVRTRGSWQETWRLVKRRRSQL